MAEFGYGLGRAVCFFQDCLTGEFHLLFERLGAMYLNEIGVYRPIFTGGLDYISLKVIQLRRLVFTPAGSRAVLLDFL